MNEADQQGTARQRAQARYRALYDEVVAVLVQIDPIGVHGQDDTEPFVPEAASILARLHDARLAEDVEQILLEELRRWYGRRALAHRDPDRLTRATIAICAAWNRFLATSAS
jgi:hypothetical protein